MAERLGEAVLELRTDDSRYLAGVAKAQDRARGLDGTLQRTERSAERLGRRLSDLGGRAQRLGQTLSLALTAPLLAFGFLSVKTASDAQELGNLIAVTFGASAEAVEDWSERTAEAMNRSSIALLKAAGDFAAFLKPLGVAPDMVVPMSKAMAQLVTDLSSFRNIAEADVFTALFSGLAGETEAVRRLGIDIGQAAVAAELLRLGFQGNAKDASQAAKVIARYNLILRQTEDAQGDAARTAASFENQWRGLRATADDLRLDIGDRLLPTVTEFTGRLRALGRRFLALSDETKTTILTLAGIAAALGPGLIALGLLVRALGFALVGVVAFSRGVRVALRAVLVEMALLAAAFASPVFAAVAASTAILAAWILFKETIIATSKAIIDGVSFWLVKQFRNNVERPFIEAINEMIDMLPRAVRERLGVVKIEIPVEITGDAGEVFAEGFAEARAAAARETARIEAEFDALVARVKGALPEGLAELIFGDFEAMQGDIEGATGKLDALIERLTGAALKSGRPGTAAATAEETDALFNFMVALENETFLLGLSNDEREVRTRVMQANAIAMREGNLLTREEIALVESNVRAQQALARAKTESREGERRRAQVAAEALREEEAATRGIAFAIDGALDSALRGHIRTWEDLRRVAIDALQDIIDNVIRLLAIQGGATGTESLGSLLGGVLSGVIAATGSIGGGLGKGVSPTGSDIFGTPFAHGGRIGAGQLALVGERGRELFVPGVAGTIIPNHALGRGGGGGSGDSTVNVAYHITTPDANSFRVSEGQLIRLTKRRFKI